MNKNSSSRHCYNFRWIQPSWRFGDHSFNKSLGNVPLGELTSRKFMLIGFQYASLHYCMFHTLHQVLNTKHFEMNNNKQCNNLHWSLLYLCVDLAMMDHYLISLCEMFPQVSFVDLDNIIFWFVHVCRYYRLNLNVTPSIILIYF